MKTFLIILLAYSASYAQFNWTKLDGPYGGHCARLHIKGDTVLTTAINQIKATSKLYYSTNGGEYWQQADSYDTYCVGMITAHDGAVLAAMESGIYKSFNLHEWIQVRSGPIRSIAIHKSGVIYSLEGNDNYGSRNYVTQSTDNGEKWTTIFTSNQITFPSLTTTDNYLLLVSRNIIYRKKIGEDIVQWQTVKLPYINHASLAWEPDTKELYSVADYPQLIGYSKNEGADWEFRDFRDVSPQSSPINIAVSKNTILLSNDAGSSSKPSLFISTDRGFSWKEAINGSPPGTRINSIAISSDAFYAATGGYGIIKSTDYGRTWLKKSRGINEMYVTDLVLNDDKNLIVGTWGNGILKSTNLGSTWIEKNDNLHNYAISDLIRKKDGALFIGNYHGIYRSYDNAESWRKAKSPISSAFFSLDEKDNIYASNASDYRIYISKDDGISWNYFYHGDSFLRIVFNSSGTAFVTGSNKVYRSENSGLSWEEVFSDHRYYYKPLIDSTGKLFFPTSEGLLKSEDNGNSWHNTAPPIYDVRVVNIFTDNKGNYFCVTKTPQNVVQFHHSSDFGETWEDITGALNHAMIYDVVFIDGRIFLAADSGVWTCIYNPDQNSEIPNKEIYIQNYPNPFNPSTTFTYNLPDNGRVSLIIYDILGRKIKTVVDEYKTKGIHTALFHTDYLASGLYIYELKSGKYKVIKKMNLVK